MHQLICFGALSLSTVLLAIAVFSVDAVWWAWGLIPLWSLTGWGYCFTAFYPELRERYQFWQAFLAWPVLPGGR